MNLNVVTRLDYFLQALKLTGDANVPAGSISFRAKVSQASASQHLFETKDL